MPSGGRVSRGGNSLLGVDRGGVLQDRGVQGLGEGQGLHNQVQEAQLQRHLLGGALQAPDRPHAPDPGAPAVPRLPGGQRPALQPRGFRTAEGQGRKHRQDRRGAGAGPHRHTQRRELARHGRRLGDEPLQAGQAGPRRPDPQRQGGLAVVNTELVRRRRPAAAPGTLLPSFNHR